MDLIDFIKNLASVFEDTNPSNLTPETRFRDIEGWSSLIALSIIAMADEVYGVKLKGDDIRKAITVQDLYEIIKSRI